MKTHQILAAVSLLMVLVIISYLDDSFIRKPQFFRQWEFTNDSNIENQVIESIYIDEANACTHLNIGKHSYLIFVPEYENDSKTLNYRQAFQELVKKGDIVTKRKNANNICVSHQGKTTIWNLKLPDFVENKHFNQFYNQ